jgi:hypothetical protein
MCFVLLAACKIGSEPDKGDEHIDAADVPVTGMITSDTTWSGTKQFMGETVIVANVTVTVMEGTTLSFAQGARIKVDGALKLNGTVANRIIGQNDAGATSWGGLIVAGTVTMNYANFTGGAISTTSDSSNVTINDSKLFKASGDYIIMNGGSLSVLYSTIGSDMGETNGTHCNFHTNAAVSISVLHTNISNAPYGVMFYGGVNANWQYNNWFGNQKDIDTVSGVTGNVSFGWFEKGAPTAGPGAMLTADNLSPTKVPAGPREP